MTKTLKEKLEILPIKVIEHPVGNTKYYATVHIKPLIAQADEENQELLNKYCILNDNYEKEVVRSSKLESQIIELKSQLQQQALPVVPECVYRAIKQFKNDQLSLYGSLNAILSDRTTEIYAWISRGNQNAFALAFITGKYEVEKPQLFYLKSKSLLENEGESEEPDVDELYLNANGNLVIYKVDAKKFTQKEIDSMETGSYEQIKATE